MDRMLSFVLYYLLLAWPLVPLLYRLYFVMLETTPLPLCLLFSFTICGVLMPWGFRLSRSKNLRLRTQRLLILGVCIGVTVLLYALLGGFAHVDPPAVALLFAVFVGLSFSLFNFRTLRRAESIPVLVVGQVLFLPFVYSHLISACTHSIYLKPIFRQFLSVLLQPVALTG